MVTASKKNDKGQKYVSLDGIDVLVSAMKRTRRVRMYGIYAGLTEKLKQVEQKNIEELDLERQQYFDIPVKDTGDVVTLKNYRGEIIGNVPEYVRKIEWEWSDEHSTHIWIDKDDGKLWYLYPPPRPPKPEKRFTALFTNGEKIVDKWNYE